MCPPNGNVVMQSHTVRSVWLHLQVWSLADNSRRGYLDLRGFSKVSMALFVHAVL